VDLPTKYGVQGGAKEDYALAAWKLPLIIAAISVAIVGGFYLGGPGLGMAVGAAAAASIIVFAVRAVPRGPIVPAPLRDLRRHVLLVSTAPLEDPETIGEISHLCEPVDFDAEPSEVKLLVPAPVRFLDRWSSDRRASWELAQRYCVHSLAALTKAGLAVKASVGDEDVVLAVEDELRTFPATDVILVTGADDEAAEDLAAELRLRLRTDFLHLESRQPAALEPAAHGAGPRTGSRERHRAD
jgi:hypothetical protein